VTRALVRAAITAAVVFAFVWCLYGPLSARAGADDVCAEDDPCWDCATMGNLVCGPQLIPAVSIVASEPVQAPVAASPVTAG
jgi:hypothetical protein